MIDNAIQYVLWAEDGGMSRADAQALVGAALDALHNINEDHADYDKAARLVVAWMGGGVAPEDNMPADLWGTYPVKTCVAAMDALVSARLSNYRG